METINDFVARILGLEEEKLKEVNSKVLKICKDLIAYKRMSDLCEVIIENLGRKNVQCCYLFNVLVGSNCLSNINSDDERFKNLCIDIHFDINDKRLEGIHSFEDLINFLAK